MVPLDRSKAELSCTTRRKEQFHHHCYYVIALLIAAIISRYNCKKTSHDKPQPGLAFDMYHYRTGVILYCHLPSSNHLDPKMSPLVTTEFKSRNHMQDKRLLYPKSLFVLRPISSPLTQRAMGREATEEDPNCIYFKAPSVATGIHIQCGP